MCIYKYLLFITISVLSGFGYAGDYYPLDVGNTWTYKIHAEKAYHIESKVLAKVKVANTTWYKMKDFGEIFWVRAAEDGQHEAMNWYGEQRPLKSDPLDTLLFKYPVSAASIYIAGDDTVLVSYPFKKISTPAGDFECIMYTIYTDKNSFAKNCLSQGVGIVWSEVVVDGISEVAELVKYKIHSQK